MDDFNNFVYARNHTSTPVRPITSGNLDAEPEGTKLPTMADLLFRSDNASDYDTAETFCNNVYLNDEGENGIYQPRIYEAQLDLDSSEFNPDSDSQDKVGGHANTGNPSHVPLQLDRSDAKDTGIWCYYDEDFSSIAHWKDIAEALAPKNNNKIVGANGRNPLLRGIEDHPSIKSLLETLKDQVLLPSRTRDLSKPWTRLLRCDVETTDPGHVRQMIASPFMLGNVATALDICLQNLPPPAAATGSEQEPASESRFRFARPDTSSIPDILGYDNKGVCFAMMVETEEFIDGFVRAVETAKGGTFDRAKKDAPAVERESGRIKWSLNGVLRKVSCIQYQQRREWGSLM